MKRDLLYALRALRNSPAFTAVAVASLALGIGANTAIFSLVSAILLRPLPVREPQRLVSVFTSDRSNPGLLYCSYPNYKDYRDRNTVFAGLTIYTPIQVSLTGEKEAADLSGEIVAGNYFAVLGVKAALGRTFLAEEDQVPGARPVAVISHAFWMRRFNGSRGVVGSTIGLNNRQFTIVGVAPQGFHGPNALVSTELWTPMMMYAQMLPTADWIDHRKALLFAVIGRLKEGVNRRQAEDNLRIVAAQLAREYPADNEGRTAVLMALSESVIQPNSRGAFMLAGGVALGASLLVLLIACANVANLLLVRAVGRNKEMALRLALGAGRGRLAAQLLVESALLTAGGCAAALILARWGRSVLWNYRPPWMLSGDAAADFDWRVVGFTLALAIAATIAFGMAPAWSASRANLASELRERRSPWTRAGHRISVRSLLVMAQVALSVVTLAGAGLFIRSLRNAQAVDPGYDAAHLGTLALNTKGRKFRSTEGLAYFQRVTERVKRLPGIADATIGFNAPFTVYRARSLFIEGQENGSRPNAVVPVDLIEPGYFAALGIRMVRGRPFSNGDTDRAPRVAVVNETMAGRFWNGDPAGKRLRFFGDPNAVEIVGVVRDSTYINLGETPRLMVYLCLAQTYTPAATLWFRAHGDPAAVRIAVQQAVAELDRDVLLSDLQTVMEVTRESLWAPRLGAVMFGAFGALAGILTVVGLYGVISYSVGQRTRELGIRMALGAQPGAVLRQVLLEGMLLVFWGLLLGAIVMLTVAGILNSMLFGVGARDPLTLSVVLAVLTVTALAACAGPALRATRVDPLVALRDE